jgi:pimeloyl-ACP methyl ester carboxylesterase
MPFVDSRYIFYPYPRRATFERGNWVGKTPNESSTNLLLLRGLIRDRRTWGDFPERIRARSPRIRVHFLDLAGIGTENHRPSPRSITAIRVDVAHRFHDGIGRGDLPEGPWSILGLSLGGMVALDWAVAEPGLFRHLALLNVSTADVARPIERFSFRFLPGMLFALATNRPQDSERLILRAVSNRFSADREGRDPKIREILENQTKWRRERPITRSTFVNQLWAASRYRLPDSRPKPRTAVFSSEGDRLVRPRCSARVAERLGVPRFTHPWAGHDVPLDDPEWLARELVDWMESPG